jgi:peptidoglycan/xylan/chitin deacetylase (PgdA/CDA1 family)
MTSQSAAVAFTFDFDAEEVWLGEDPVNARRPVALSQGEYGARVGLPAILSLLDRLRVPATFFVPGRVAERYPGQVADLLSRGHEVAHHGYTHRAPALLSREEEAEEFERSIAALHRHGVRPVGYRAPSWELTEHTLGLVEQFGFSYSSNFMTDIRPFRHPDHDVVELPVHWTLDDAAHFWFAGDTWEKKISTNGEVEQIMLAEADGIVAMGGCCVYTFHPQIIGRPGRLALLERLVTAAQADDRTRIATLGELAQEAQAALSGDQQEGARR